MNFRDINFSGHPDFLVMARLIGIALFCVMSIALIWTGIDDMGRLANPRCIEVEGADPNDSFTRVTLSSVDIPLSGQGGQCYGHGVDGAADLPNGHAVLVTAGFLPSGYEWREQAATLSGPTGILVNRMLVALAGVAAFLTFGVLGLRELV